MGPSRRTRRLGDRFEIEPAVFGAGDPDPLPPAVGLLESNATKSLVANHQVVVDDEDGELRRLRERAQRMQTFDGAVLPQLEDVDVIDLSDQRLLADGPTILRTLQPLVGLHDRRQQRPHAVGE